MNHPVALYPWALDQRLNRPSQFLYRVGNLGKLGGCLIITRSLCDEKKNGRDDITRDYYGRLLVNLSKRSPGFEATQCDVHSSPSQLEGAVSSHYYSCTSSVLHYRRPSPCRWNRAIFRMLVSVFVPPPFFSSSLHLTTHEDSDRCSLPLFTLSSIEL